MTERACWRRAVKRSRLPAGVKLTLLTHSEQGAGHWHDESNNAHGYAQHEIAKTTNRDEATVKRNLRRARADGFLVEHERGHRGQRQGRGQQTVFHYQTPTDPWPCATCEKGDLKGDTTEAPKGVRKLTPSVPLSGVQNVPPSSTSINRDGWPGAHADHDETDPASQRFSGHSAAAAPQRTPTTDNVTGPRVPTGRTREATTPPPPPPCTACGLARNPALVAAEPWHRTHPSCDEPGDADPARLHALAVAGARPW